MAVAAQVEQKAQVKKSFEPKCGKTPCECGKNCGKPVERNDWKGKCMQYETFFVQLSKLDPSTQLMHIFPHVPHSATLVAGFQKKLAAPKVSLLTAPVSELVALASPSAGIITRSPSPNVVRQRAQNFDGF